MVQNFVVHPEFSRVLEEFIENVLKKKIEGIKKEIKNNTTKQITEFKEEIQTHYDNFSTSILKGIGLSNEGYEKLRGLICFESKKQAEEDKNLKSNLILI